VRKALKQEAYQVDIDTSLLSKASELVAEIAGIKK
jgi:hypothetical protein